MGTSWGNQRTGGQWSAEESGLHINVLKLKAELLTLQTIKKFQNPKSIHLKIDNTSALSYIVKMEDTQNLGMIGLAKEIWDLTSQTTITVEYLPSRLNKVADSESRNCNDSSELKLDPQVFHQIYETIGGWT